MRNFILFFMFICVSCLPTKQFVSTDNAISYKIKKIESNHIINYIHAQRNDTTFRIISIIDTIYSDFETIKIGNYYQLDLMKVYPNDLIEKGIDEAKLGAIDGCFLDTDKKTHYTLYVAKNLNGLSVSNNQQSEKDIVEKFSIYTIFCDACKKKYKFSLGLYVK